MSGMEPMLMALQAAGSIGQGIAGLQAGNAAGRVADENARRSLLQGELDVQDILRQERRQAGQAVVDLAGSGVMLGEGSARDILEQSAMQREIDVLRARREATGQAENYRQQAADARAQGRAALVGGLFSAVTDTLQGVRTQRANRILDAQAKKERAVILGQQGSAGDIVVTRGGGFMQDVPGQFGAVTPRRKPYGWR